MKNKPRSRQSNLLVQECVKELLIYDLLINKAYCLNETSALVYQLSDGSKSVKEISYQMSQKLQQVVSEDFVYLTLNELKKENLLTNGQEIEDKFAGMSRRQIIKRIGLASMVALPIISAVIAPTALRAASEVCNCPNELPVNCLPRNRGIIFLPVVGRQIPTIASQLQMPPVVVTGLLLVTIFQLCVRTLLVPSLIGGHLRGFKQ